MISVKSHLELEICVQQHLEFKGSVSLIGYNQASGESLGIKSDTIKKVEVVRPETPDFVAEACCTEPKVELYARITTLAAGLAKKLPLTVACKPMLW